ncbi:MAG: gliding motility-associated ABC transporter substrate-binding protein GldG [Flavobacteriales bacterium]|nr:gliding motility-associated ABC transporter substrate-binding protein GldG [Flavobacteriales bacterium]
MVRKVMLRDIIQLLTVVGIVIALNVLSGFFFTRFDLTTEKRYTLSETSKDLLENLDDVIYLKVYLDGELPAGFRRLRDRTREMLDEFRAYSNNNIEYEFINPSNQPDEKSRNDLYRQLAKQGLMPTNIQIKAEDGVEQKLIFPGAIMTYRGQETAMQLLKSQMGAAPEQMLNSSTEDLEYEITNAIRKMTSLRAESIGFIEGHGELTERQVADMAKSLSEYYRLERVTINGKLNSLVSRAEGDSGAVIFPKYKAIIIAKPDTIFSEEDKFMIDQYIMYGGRVLWLVESVFCNMDSLRYAPSTLAIPTSVNLEDMLFKYGVRVNTDLLQDARCAAIPGPSGYVGNQLQWALQPWVFFPIVIPKSEHPIVRNLNGIKLEFTSSLDTVGKADIKKTVLLSTSDKTRALRTPTQVSLDVMVEEPKPEQFNKRNLPVAVLLEGRFESVFKNRLTEMLKESRDIQFRESGKSTKMIVVSDGDIMRNHINPDGTYLPCGFDQYTSQQFGNKTFLLNAINYLCDDMSLTSIRSRALEIRLLDRKKAEAERSKWQIINVAIPIGLVLLFGFINAYFRKKRFGSVSSKAGS